MPLQDIPGSITEDEHEVKEASQNTILDMRELMALDKSHQRIQGEFTNSIVNVLQLTILEHEKHKIDVIANDATYIDGQQTYKNI